MIGHHGLADWFLSSFGDDERTYMEERWKPFGSSGAMTLTTGQREGQPSRDDTHHFLVFLAGWFDSKSDASVGMRILAKAREYEGDVVNQHVYLMKYIQTRYKQRNDDPVALDDVIDACEKMIALAPRVREGMQREHDAAEERSVELGLATKRERFPGVPPRHVGFERLIIIRKKQKQTDEAQRLQESYEREWKAHSLDARRRR